VRRRDFRDNPETAAISDAARPVARCHDPGVWYRGSIRVKVATLLRRNNST
jgi:hypothetical protein